MQRVPKSLPWLTLSIFTALLLSAAAVLALPGRAMAACPPAVTVTNTLDSGFGSLRQAISDVCADGTIDFAASLTSSGPVTITLTSGELYIGKNMTIDGPGANLLAVSGNNASRVFNIGSGVHATLDGLTILDGYSGNANGGGINNGGTLTVTNSALLSNSVGGSNRGGALYNGSGGQATLANCIVAGNSSPDRGGGIYTTGNGLLSITNTTFYNNTGSMGGALSTSYGYAQITNSTFSGNTATSSGAAIRTSLGAITLTNTILQGSLNGGNCSINPLTDSGGNISDDDSCGFTAASSYNKTDPLLTALADYGGDTQTMALLPGSPAIDGGVTAGCPATDQRGVTRPQGGACDSGAFESQGFTLTVSGGSSQTATVYSAFAQPLAVTVGSVDGSPTGPRGVVTFTPPAEGPGLNVTNPITAGTNISGTAATNVTANAVGGSYNVTATVRGEINLFVACSDNPCGGAPPIFDLTNERIEPAISLSSSPNPSVFTELVMLSANVTTDVSGANTPTGIVTFTVDGDYLGTDTLDAWGAASVGISSLPVGSYTVVAEYSGDVSFEDVQSDSVTQVVNKAPTETELKIKPHHVLYGDKVSFGVMVTSDAPSPTAQVQRFGPSGAVTISDAGGLINLDGWVINGEAAVSGGIIPAGTYTVVATYIGDDNFEGSVSQPATLVVEKLATSTELTSSGSPVYVGDPLSFLATVGVVLPDSIDAEKVAYPTGAVVITDTTGAINLGGSLTNGVLQVPAPLLPPGTYTVTATYLGDERLAPSVSTQLIQVVERHATATTLELTPSQVQVGEMFQLEATVRTMDPQALVNGGPVGVVEFLADGKSLGGATLVNGRGSVSVPANSAGVFQLTARYMGNNIYAPSDSDPAQITVVKRPTTTTLIGAPNPSKQRKSVLFTATVAEQVQGAGSAAARPIPSGTVIFAANGSEFGRANLFEGAATVSYAQLPVGNVTITAQYAGDDMFAGSQSADHQQTVLPMPLAVNDAAGAQVQPVSINVTANDLDPAGGGLTVVSVSAPTNGSATIEPNSRNVIYTPKAGYSGTDTFTYVVQDSNGNQDDALVVVVVTTPADGQEKPQVQVTDPMTDSTAAFTGTRFTLDVLAPAGFFTDILAPKDVLFISFTPVLTPTEETDQPPANLKFGNAEFILEVYLNDQLLTGQSFAVPLEVVINYDPAVLGGLKPETLGLWYWDGAAWSTDGVTIISHDVANHTLTVSMTHFSLYAFFAAAPTGLDPGDEPEAPFRLYLPNVNK